MKIRIPILYKIVKRYEEKLTGNILANLDYKQISNSYIKCQKLISVSTPKHIEFKHCIEPKISIIIPVYNQFELTMNCLLSVKNSTDKSTYEIILVDDNSTDKTKEIKQYVKGITVIRNELNQGFLKNCNAAAKIAKGEYLYFLNNDTVLFPNAIAELEQILDQTSDCGIVGSKLLYPDGKIQSAGSKLSKKLNPYLIGQFHNSYEKEYNILRKVNHVCGASLMTRKSLWEKLNGFDEIFSPGYFEETDYCLRAKRLGFKTIYQPKSEIIHLTSCSFKEKANLLIERNRKVFKQKHKNHHRH